MSVTKLLTYQQGASGLSKNLVADFNSFTPNQPLEKWIKKRTSVKIRYIYFVK